jgi:hypothetical protein
MKFEIGKRVWVKPLKMEATIEKIFYTPQSEWDDENIPQVGNILLRYDDGVLGESNNWQLGEIQKEK